jgi:hypothetical protein
MKVEGAASMVRIGATRQESLIKGIQLNQQGNKFNGYIRAELD